MNNISAVLRSLSLGSSVDTEEKGVQVDGDREESPEPSNRYVKTYKI
jgi:hypothetical protein